ncbi:MAG: type I-E CRISPR-associated protein Cse1/CasA [Holophaga sp.]|nr:type I-E CRISPR-associated protein Cse1/CasA [Holophaga sp.]
MNVAFDPWIPVVTQEGKPELASLCQVLSEGHRYADLAVRPHERVALMRLFLCVAHAALDGPKDYDAWCEVPKRLPDAARKYLDTWKDSFELFHATKPWLQVANLESGKDADEGWGPVSKLGFFLASGANTTLFDHDGMDNDGRSIPLESTILSMLAFQCFSPGGLIAQVYWDKVQTTKSSKDGPCVSASMAHALIRRKNLLLTIHANLPSIEAVGFAYSDLPIGRPVWEAMPAALKDQMAVQNATTTYFGRMVPLTRAIRLHTDGQRMLLGDGLPYPTFADGFSPEPTAIVVIRTKEKKQERALLSFRPGKALWRELPAVIVKRSCEGVGGPLAMQSLEEGCECDLLVLALARDQATILDTTESVYHIPGRLRSVEGLAIYQAEVKAAETLATRLGWAIEDYRRTLDGCWDGRLKSAGPSKGELLARLHGAGLTHFWTSVETNLDLLIAHVEAYGTDAFEVTGKAWESMLRGKAREAYEAVCGQGTPRQIKAFAQGWKKLNERPKGAETEPQLKEEA